MGLNASTTKITYLIESQSNSGSYGINNTFIGDYIAAYKLEYTTSGTNTFTVPDWSSKMAAILISGGGGGADETGAFSAGGGGGAGAAMATVVLSVIAGTDYVVIVGAGGAGGTSLTNSTNGGNTRLSYNGNVLYDVSGGGRGDFITGGAQGTVLNSSNTTIKCFVNGNAGGTVQTSTTPTTGGNGGSRSALNTPSPTYCNDFIATGGTGTTSDGESGDGPGAGGSGGGAVSGSTNPNGGSGNAGYACIYFYY
jgi:hypothetical protein